MPETLGRAVQLALGGLQNDVFQSSFFERQHHFSAILQVFARLKDFRRFLTPPKLEREHHLGYKTTLGVILWSPELEF